MGDQGGRDRGLAALRSEHQDQPTAAGRPGGLQPVSLASGRSQVHTTPMKRRVSWRLRAASAHEMASKSICASGHGGEPPPGRVGRRPAEVLIELSSTVNQNAVRLLKVRNRSRGRIPAPSSTTPLVPAPRNGRLIRTVYVKSTAGACRRLRFFQPIGAAKIDAGRGELVVKLPDRRDDRRISSAACHTR